MNQETVFVMGLSSFGKSHYIDEHYKDYKKVDIFDYQDYPIPLISTTLKSYYDCAADLIEAIANNEKVVLEHTLAKAKRRRMYIEICQELTGKGPVGIMLLPSYETFARNNKVRFPDMPVPEKDFYDYIMKVIELPTTKEGFSRVEIIKY